MKDWDLSHKKALITGGTKGIGRAAVEQFLKLGAEVIFTARNTKEITDLASSLENDGFKVEGIKADLAQHSEMLELKNQIERRWGKLDVLVNNAGMNIRKATIDYQAEEYHQVININLLAQLELCRLLYPLLRLSGQASIINVASVAGTADAGTGSPYGVSKAGLIQLSRSLAVEWAIDKIRVNSISPWFTATPLTESLLANDEKLDMIIDRTPMKRVASPHEMASVISFLAMDHSSYVSGQDIVVDGGMTASIF